MRFRILIVDDNPKNIQIAAGILKSEENLLGFAKSGEEALQRLQEAVYDLILMDVMMPGMDGFEAARHIKQLTDYKQTPVIFVTAKSADEDVLEGFYSGGVDYITKPYNATELRARVHAHLTLKTLRDRLEERVEEETQKRLAQQELLVRQSRLAAMGEMMSAILHQWKQPLSIIGMSADIIQGAAEEPEPIVKEITEQCAQIKKSVQFMSQTARDFNSYFSPQKKTFPFSVCQEVETVLSMLAPQLRNRAIRTEVSIDSSLRISGTPSEFKQVVLNLVGNASDAIAQKANPKEGGWLGISAEEREGVLVLNFCDDGAGIPEEALPRLFEPHFTTKGEKGTGIGLSISQMIIEESFKGTICAQNRQQGACFTLHIPLYHSA